MGEKINFITNSNPTESSENKKSESLKELERKWEHDEEILNKILDPIQSDNSVDAWKLRNSFIESVDGMIKDIDGYENKLLQLGYQMDNIGMYSKKYNIKKMNDNEYKKYQEEATVRSNFYDKKVVKDRVLKLLALNVSGISSKESLNFREELFKLGTHITYMTESLENVYQDNKEATELYDKYLKEWARINKVDLNQL